MLVNCKVCGKQYDSEQQWKACPHTSVDAPRVGPWHNAEDFGCNALPSEEEIQQMASQINQGWSENERELRNRYRIDPVEYKEQHLSHGAASYRTKLEDK